MTETVYRVGSGYIFLIFGLGFILGALLWIVFETPVTQLLDLAESHSSTAEANEGIGYVRAAWNGAPVFIALLGMIQLLIGAARIRSRGGWR